MSWTITPCAPDDAAEISGALGISELTATVLVRRGYDTVEAARSFLDGADPGHDPFLLGHMAEACERIRATVAAGERICVHGDYDADGICATALALLVLRELGADPGWHLPSRFDEGYGVQVETVRRLAEEGYDLLITVDCGITALEAVDEAGRVGLDVIVTDHHRPAERLPDCPVVATRPSSYPFPELCGTGVVHKLGQALLGRDSEALRGHLDLVALATIADVVPLVDENRALAIEGLRRLAATQKLGLRALMRSAHVDAAVVDSGAVGFRLAPRINAAGRLGHPASALELLLTDDKDTARRLAAELEQLNRERQGVEDAIVRDAVRQVEEWPEATRRRRAYVLASEEWHEGVIGIVASRLAERYHRPVVLIAAGEKEWKGSGRSVPAFDLHAGLGACSGHLERFGGHRAAAGLAILPEQIETFATAFAEHAASVLGEDDLRRTTRVDAIVPRGLPLTLELCQELARLAPFGLGNPNVTLLAPACALQDLGSVGDGKHLKFRVRTEAGVDGGSAIGFGMGRDVDRYRRTGLYDVAFRLQENRWNGTVAPQLVVQRIFDTPEEYVDLAARFRRDWRRPTPDIAAVLDELAVDAGVKRHLLESERFRELLVDVPLPRAA